ncbi:MAG: hypothetical protein ICV51_18075 [Flavisolibacter sp.]|nr:hypothetical protein [Flavisolibacter sp.]
MCDISRVKRNGFKDAMTEKERNNNLNQIGEQRRKEFEGGEAKMVIGTPKK